MAKLLRKNVMQ